MRGFPVHSTQQVIDYLQGRNMEKAPAIEGSYDLLGYALEQLNGKQSVRAGMPNQQDAVAEFQNAINQAQSQAQSFAQPPTVQARQPKQADQSKQGDQPKAAAAAPTPAQVGVVTIPPWTVAFLLLLLQRLATT